jgi:hypothetical protein
MLTTYSPPCERVSSSAPLTAVLTRTRFSESSVLRIVKEERGTVLNSLAEAKTAVEAAAMVPLAVPDSVVTR